MLRTRADGPTRLAVGSLAVVAVLAGTAGLVTHQHRADGAPTGRDVGVVSSAPTATATATASSAEAEPTGPTDGAGLLSTHSTELGAQGGDAVAATAVAIPRLHLRAAVGAVGLAADDRSLDLPPSAHAVVWWAYGASPGASAGTVLLAGHVSWNGQVGVLAGLPSLRVGDVISVRRADGSAVRYAVTGRRRVPKMSLAELGLFAAGGPPRLVLVTCGGAFDAARHSYEDNVVVQARPI